MIDYRVVRGDTLSAIAAAHQLSLNALLALNPRFKADPNRLAVGDVLAVPEQAGRIEPGPAGHEPGPAVARDWFKVPVGQLTFDAEGLENEASPYHSRRPHVPGRWSGVTIGRGYDMKHRSSDGIYTDLRQSGVSERSARRLSHCAGYQGAAAKRCLREQGLEGLSISAAAQYRLFLATYEEIVGDIIRICTKSDVIHKYGATDWERLHPLVRDILVDLRYRGDYTPATRERVQPIVVANDPEALTLLMADEDYWRAQCGVPRDRFRRRRNYCRNWARAAAD